MLNQRKRVPTLEEMVDRIKAAVDARQDPDFVIVARTGALAIEGLQTSLNRAAAYGEAGADVIFPEAVTDLGQYGPFARAAGARILATITEFGATPLFDVDELRTGGVAIAICPLSAFRAMNKAALGVYETIRRDGTQKSVIGTMQTRAELYECLDYHSYERKLDELFAKARE